MQKPGQCLPATSENHVFHYLPLEPTCSNVEYTEQVLLVLSLP